MQKYLYSWVCIISIGLFATACSKPGVEPGTRLVTPPSLPAKIAVRQTPLQPTFLPPQITEIADTPPTMVDVPETTESTQSLSSVQQTVLVDQPRNNTAILNPQDVLNAQLKR